MNAQLGRWRWSWGPSTGREDGGCRGPTARGRGTSWTRRSRSAFRDPGARNPAWFQASSRPRNDWAPPSWKGPSARTSDGSFRALFLGAARRRKGGSEWDPLKGILEFQPAACDTCRCPRLVGTLTGRLGLRMNFLPSLQSSCCQTAGAPASCTGWGWEPAATGGRNDCAGTSFLLPESQPWHLTTGHSDGPGLGPGL